jgi:hypothetical protein
MRGEGEMMKDGRTPVVYTGRHPTDRQSAKVKFGCSNVHEVSSV